MAKCPKCGMEVSTPRKTWKMAGRPDRTGKRTELTIALFDCARCNVSFRKVLSKRKVLSRKKLEIGLYDGPIVPPHRRGRVTKKKI